MFKAESICFVRYVFTLISPSTCISFHIYRILLETRKSIVETIRKHKMQLMQIHHEFETQIRSQTYRYQWRVTLFNVSIQSFSYRSQNLSNKTLLHFHCQLLLKTWWLLACLPLVLLNAKHIGNWGSSHCPCTIFMQLYHQPSYRVISSSTTYSCSGVILPSKRFIHGNINIINTI
jgi:hypothetical protein